MSVLNILTSMSEGSVYKEKIQIGIEMTTKGAYYSMITQLLLKNKSNQRLVVINYDINFYKYLQAKNFSGNQNITHIFWDVKNLTKNFLNEKNDSFSDCFVLILGLDLLEIDSISFILNKVLSKTEKFLIQFSLEKNFMNLSNEIEEKKNIIKNRL